MPQKNDDDLGWLDEPEIEPTSPLTEAEIAEWERRFAHEQAEPPNGANGTNGHHRELEAIMQRADQVRVRELEPLWQDVLWIGKPTLIAGDPGLGKSLVTLDIAARVSRGTPWPCDQAQRDAGDVVLVSGEDDPEDTIVPRLKAAGADLERIHFIQGIRRNLDDGESREELLNLEEHTLALAEAIEGIKPRLLVVDPISAFMGRADSHRNTEVRRILAMLARVAQSCRLAVLVVSHLSKGDGSALKRISGSLAFVAAPRCVYCVVRDPDQHARRLMLPVKCNLGPDLEGFAYGVKLDDGDNASVVWEQERVEQSADEIMAKDLSPREAAVIEKVHVVQQWLKEQLAHGALPAASMWQRSEEAGHSRRSIERAKKALGIIVEPKGFKGAWHWSLPA